MAKVQVVESPTTGNRISPNLLNELCEEASSSASCISASLQALVIPLEDCSGAFGLANIVKMLAKETRTLCDNVANIPLKAKEVDHD